MALSVLSDYFDFNLGLTDQSLFPSNQILIQL